MYDRMQTLSREALGRIHDASMEILKGTGIAFNEPRALTLFKSRGFKVENDIVFFDEKQIRTALDHAPSRFTLHARNREHNVSIGENDFVFVPAYGAPFIAMPNGEQRLGTLGDYQDFCKLVQTSRHIDMNGYLMVEPSDVSPETSGIDMVLSNLLFCDKAFMGCQTNRKIARDLIEMSAMAFCDSDKEKLKEKTYSVSLINSLSPLQYAEEMTGALMELAYYGQAVCLANMVMGGTSGPVPLPGIMALINAEVLAGITLAQLVNPGTPVIYGSTSTVTNFKTGAALVGNAEQALLVAATAQMAQFYQLPSRSGGGLCDAHVPDAQTGYEGGMHLLLSVISGVNFILHACGQMAGHISISFEKFLIDEEFCGMLRRIIQPIEITEENLDVATIQEIGIGGHYLDHPKTFQLCRSEYFQNELFCHESHAAWKKNGSRRIDAVARETVKQRLSGYQAPDIDPGIKKYLIAYVNRRKGL